MQCRGGPLGWTLYKQSVAPPPSPSPFFFSSHPIQPCACLTEGEGGGQGCPRGTLPDTSRGRPRRPAAVFLLDRTILLFLMLFHENLENNYWSAFTHKFAASWFLREFDCVSKLQHKELLAIYLLKAICLAQFSQYFLPDLSPALPSLYHIMA